MRDAAGVILYVGKAKNLRKRLASYRVANPDRMQKRQLRLLSSVETIEFQECADESSALAREAGLLRSVRPRFNRAGTWPGRTWIIGWRSTEHGFQLLLSETAEAGWHCSGPVGGAAIPLRGCLARLFWRAFYPERGVRGMPEGWFKGRHGREVTFRLDTGDPSLPAFAASCLDMLFQGEAEKFIDWVHERHAHQAHPFELSALEADLELLQDFAEQRKRRAQGSG
jgi:hypothetical protein